MGEVQRWTAKKKADIVLQILRQSATIIDVARQNDLTPSEVQRWIDTFVKGGEQSLKAKAPDVVAQYEQEVKELRSAIGELYVENAVLKKAKTLWGSPEESES
ncbi:transposase [Gracilinema caldarium]|jgi:transposase-like protein|uniref:transposase n=1 Tax=Gracilinema caldarium TaxID=215591 RepID=UPI0026EEF94F|nr:transposase [Gracilinema caldarium]